MSEIKVQLRQIGDCTSQASLRGHQVLVDRPVEKGGSDQGPMGGELFLAAVGGCFMSNLLAAIRARKLAVSNARADVTGTVVDSPARFTAIELYVTADGADPGQLDHLVEIADRGCIMMNTLRDKMEVRIRTGVAA